MMLKRLEADALRADIASVERLLSERTEEDDPVGWFQFQSRKKHLESKLRDLEQRPSTMAGVAMFFGGRPVAGSRGILAEFGAKALERFQDLVSTRYAALDGPLGERGPVPQRGRAQMMITDLARGSIGFVLEGFDESEQLVDTPLKRVVDDVCDLIIRFSSPEPESLEQVTEEIDNRLLGDLRQFFKQIDDAGATMRLVDDQRDIALDRDAIERARERSENLELIENTETATGILYLLPEARRFELHAIDGGETRKGVVTRACLDILLGTGTEVPEGIIGRPQTVQLRVKEVRSPNQLPRRAYTLQLVLSDTKSGSFAHE